MSVAQAPSSPLGAIAGRFNNQQVPRTASRSSLTGKSTAGAKTADGRQRSAVNVAIRIRPTPPPNDPTVASVPPRFRASRCQPTDPTTLAIDTAQGCKQFTFDRVFSGSETQDGIWNHVSEAVNAFVQGYNVSILAYGQSGAGKSYSMGTSNEGEQTTSSGRGIIPRAAAALFKKIPQANLQDASSSPRSFSSSQSSQTHNRPDGSAWQLKATYVEIYNEQLRDLLVSDTTSTERTPITLREDTKGRILVVGAKEVVINSVEDLLQALNFGSSIRQTDSTPINAKSSRSHAVFTLNLVQTRHKLASATSPASPTSAGDASVLIDSKLNFVDLAGSERLKNTGSVGERIKEGISINAGLASLGKVISQLSSRSAGTHVSYRDSRLTRLLQDSLGGTAITYMIACVNPVEFHLSETLNTVQYAQRARAIQSKPQIQQRTQESEKQLVIDRLRSEIAYLRDQLRLSEQNGRRTTLSQDRTGRKQARENELQNQLLDSQEHYSTLSQRHAKLIGEISKDKNSALQIMPALKAALEKTGRTNVHSSKNFSAIVEDVILDYEKSIQNLQSSVSNTRSSLSTTESSLLEREAKIVYLEAVAQQLQGRIQRSNEREADNEAYLRELEAKLDGMNNGQDQHLVVVQELRNELTRTKESETSAEDYIATLEERLAEAEQDLELMQREISRLEHIVQRQRSIGKLDNLLAEFDTTNLNDTSSANRISDAAFEDVDIDAFHDRLIATTSASHPNEEMLPDRAEDEWKGFGPMDGEDEDTFTERDVGSRAQTPNGQPRPSRHNRAQSKAVADKLETMAIELFELRVDHESTLSELEDTTQRLQTALGTLADLQHVFSEARQPKRASFLDSAGLHDYREDGLHPPSRVLSSDLSSLGEAPTLVENSDAGTSSSDRVDYRHMNGFSQKEESITDMIRNLLRVNAEKDISISELTENYTQLQDQHNDTLNYIEELKEELTKTPESNPQSNGFPERTSSLKMDTTALTTMRQELQHRKSQFSSLYEGHAAQEQQLSSKIQSFKSSLARHAEFLATIPTSTSTDAPDHANDSKAAELAGLENDIAAWQMQQDSSSASMRALEQQMLQTVTEIETKLQQAETNSPQYSGSSDSNSVARKSVPTNSITNTAQQLAEVELLKNQISAQNKKFAQLEASYTQLLNDVEQDEKTRGVNGTGSHSRRAELADLEDQLDQQKSLAMFHQQGVKSMQESHAKEVEQLQRNHDQTVLSLRYELAQNNSENASFSRSTASWNGNGSSVLQSRIHSLEDERQQLTSKHQEMDDALTAAEERMNADDAVKQDLEAQVQELTALNEETIRQLEMSLDKERRSSKNLLDLEQQLESISSIRNPRVTRALPGNEDEVAGLRNKIAALESQLEESKRISNFSDTFPRSQTNGHSTTHPLHRAVSPPPTGPLPPLPLSANPTYQAHLASQSMLTDYETRVRTIEKHLYAEKQLTQTLEEALVDLESQNNRTRTDADAWKRKCRELEEEASGLRRERGTMRNSLQAVEEERDRRIRAEQARRQLEERMEALGRKKKGRSLNCF